MGRNTDAQRNRLAVRLVQLQLLVAQRANLPSLEWLADVLRVCPRTVRRDLAALEEAGWPIPVQRKREVV